MENKCINYSIVSMCSYAFRFADIIALNKQAFRNLVDIFQLLLSDIQ